MKRTPLKRRSPLRAKKNLARKRRIARKIPHLKRTRLKTKSRLKRTPFDSSKKDAKRRSEAKRFHDKVFRKYGPACRLCDDASRPAEVAAHVIGRAHLGKYRFADPALARPAHDKCHKLETNNKIQFSLPIRIAATLAHNRLNTKAKLQVPII